MLATAYHFSKENGKHYLLYLFIQHIEGGKVGTSSVS